MLKIWKRICRQVASRWVEGAVLAAVAIQAFGTGPARRAPAERARPATVVTRHAVMAAPDVGVRLPLGGAIDPSPLESFDLRADVVRAHRHAAATRALEDAARARHAALGARRAAEQRECERAKRQAAPRAPVAPRAAPSPAPSPAPAATPNLRRHTAV